MRRYIAPVYDYALMTEPLSAEQRSAIGWKHRQGVGDGANQFHYYRLSKDNRILLGGYDAVYRYGGPVDPKLRRLRPQLRHALAALLHDLPAAGGHQVHATAGAARSTPAAASAPSSARRTTGRTAYAVGYTGLGVAATRFGAQTALDLLDGKDTEATRLEWVKKKPVPFPPEPLRYPVIQLTANRMARADRNQGKRGLWLKLLDRLGLGFDS